MGSRGDVQPAVALGARLQHLGYAVTLAAPADFRGFVAEHGLAFAPFSFEVRDGVESDLGRRWLRGTSASRVREATLMWRVTRYPADVLAGDLEHLPTPGDRLRRRISLRRRGFRGFVSTAHRTPVILGASPAVVPRAPEWPAGLVQTGFRDELPHWEPPPGLARFRSDGPPPVHLGFEDAPYEWLFPRCAAVVHHGGGGTAAGALRAGVPQVAVPHIADQPYWADGLTSAGWAVRPSHASA
jgi:UDP:flavonoid glycosyltransferase YjiC (YdhE family)